MTAHTIGNGAGSRSRGGLARPPRVTFRAYHASALSKLNFGIEPLQFYPRFVDCELPIDGSLLLVDTV